MESCLKVSIENKGKINGRLPHSLPAKPEGITPLSANHSCYNRHEGFSCLQFSLSPQCLASNNSKGVIKMRRGIEIYVYLCSLNLFSLNLYYKTCIKGFGYLLQ